MEFILNNKIEMNHTYITTLINSVVTLPEKYMLTDHIVDKYGIVDLKKEEEEHRVQKLYHQNIYVSSTR